MAKKKKDPTKRNFFRVVAVFGFILVAWIGYEFVSAAPKLSPAEHHKNKTIPQCLACHTQNVENTPIMPHRPMGSCDFCHSPVETP